MANEKIVIANVSFSNLLSYRRCIKNSSTKVDLIEAIINATQMLRAPKSIPDAYTVIPVRANRASRTTSNFE